MAELQLDNVTKRYGSGSGEDSIIAVEDATLNIADGGFLVLVGPSGCGKSTTLRMIAGLETVTEGKISINGERVNEEPARDRDIAMVFQSYALYPHMSARGNMSFGLEESTDLSGDEITERVEETARMMGIEELLERRPGDMSGGQQQRVALGRAIVRDPSVFLLDEPLSNLDAKLRAQMRTELQRLQEELGVTTVYVTHDQTEAMTMGDRIAVLNDGRLQQVGTPLECYHQPPNRFVAGFMGEPSMNFFEMEVESGDREGDQLVGEFMYPISGEPQKAVGTVTDVTLGVRPEDIELREGDEPTSAHEFETKVDVIEPTGDTNQLHLVLWNSDIDEQSVGMDLDEGMDPDRETAPDRVTIVVTVSGMQHFDVDQTVIARIPEEAIHLFDAETGEALCNRSLEEGETTETEF